MMIHLKESVEDVAEWKILHMKRCRSTDLRRQRADSTIVEVLQLVDGKVPLLIEVKLPNTDTKICRKLDEELRKYHGEYMIQSFNSLVLRWMKKHRNEIPRGQLSENLTKNDRTTHYLLRFCVKYLLSNCMCRPDFISYRWSDRKNPGLWLNRVLFKTPAAAWTLHGEKDVKAARRSFDMYIFEMS